MDSIKLTSNYSDYEKAHSYKESTVYLKNMNNNENKLANMHSVTIEKSKFLEILRENKEKHEAAYEAAVLGYWDAATEKIRDKQKEFNEALESAKQDFSLLVQRAQNKIDAKKAITDNSRLTFKFNSLLGLNYPQNFSKKYEECIRRMELSVHEQAELGNEEFECYVLDNWDWKAKFNIENTGYVTRAVNANNLSALGRKHEGYLKSIQ